MEIVTRSLGLVSGTWAWFQDEQKAEMSLLRGGQHKAEEAAAGTAAEAHGGAREAAHHGVCTARVSR